MGYTPPYLDVRKVAGAYNVYAPSNTSTDDISIYPNTVDTYSYIQLLGGAGIVLVPQTGAVIQFNDGANGTHLTIGNSGSDVAITTTATNHNLSFVPNGSGLVKFGAYTAGAATDSTGYITILDAGGNTRKLMVQA